MVVKFRLSTWDKGEEFIQELAKVTKATIELRDAKQIVETPFGKVTFHPDDRGFAYFTCKITNDKLKDIISQMREKFE